jgi:hypothetical protein
MRIDQAVGYALAQTSAITNITSTRIYHGTRPLGSVVPCINYFMLSGTRKNGFESNGWTINCRATTAGIALELARAVVDLFHGTSSTGGYGAMNNFEFSRCSLRNTQGCIWESQDNLYNAPVDIQMVYPSSSVS